MGPPRFSLSCPVNQPILPLPIYLPRHFFLPSIFSYTSIIIFPVPLYLCYTVSSFSLPLSLNHAISPFLFPYLSIMQFLISRSYNFCFSLSLSLNHAISASRFPYLSIFLYSASLFPYLSIMQFLHPSSHIFLSCNFSFPLSMSFNHTISPSVSPFSPLDFPFLLIFSSSVLLPSSSVSTVFPFFFSFSVSLSSSPPVHRFFFLFLLSLFS